MNFEDRKILEIALVDGPPERLSSIEDLISAVFSTQQVALVHNKLRKSNIANIGEITLDLHRPGDKHPRYTMYVLDQPSASCGRTYAAFIVPLGKNITNIDISHAVMECMQIINNYKRSHLRYEQMSAIQMTYPDKNFNVILDKGTLDALMPDNKETTIIEIDKYFKVLEIALVDGSLERLSSIEDMISAVFSTQQLALVYHRLHTSNIAHIGEITLDLHRPGDNHPRDTVYVIDQPISHCASKQFAAFIVPQGKEMDWTFRTKRGRQNIAKSMKRDRLAIVTLRRDHTFESFNEIMKELIKCLLDLTPADSDVEFRIPFLSFDKSHDHIGKRTIWYQGESNISGPFVVEDVKDYELRRLVFLDNLYVIQSEARLKEAKGRRGRTRKIADLGFLAPKYHGYMVGYVNAVIDTEAEDEILVLGLRGSGLCMYLHCCFPKASIFLFAFLRVYLKITAVEIDNAILTIATRYFNFVTNDKVKVEIADGIQFVKDAATSGKKYKAILCDMDNKDSSIGMSFPPKEFLEMSVLRAVASSLTQDGLFILNLVTTDRSLKEKATDDLESVFEPILEYNLNSANAVVVCSAEKYNIKEWRNKFKNAIVDFDKLAIARKLSFSINIARILKSLYGEFPELCNILLQYIKKTDNILIIGCGKSTVGMSLYDAGYKNITKIDISYKTDVPDPKKMFTFFDLPLMQYRRKTVRPDLISEYMDATQMTYPDEKFNVVLDKGILDILMPDTEETTIAKIDKYFKVLEVDLVDGRLERLSSIEDMISAVFSTQQLALMLNKLRNSNIVDIGEVSLDLQLPGDEHPRTKEGRQEAVKQTGRNRLAIVTLRREHTFKSLFSVKQELAACMSSLAPDFYKELGIPVLILGDIGTRTIWYQGESNISGPFVVEDVKDYEVRRLIFLNNPYVIQSEARLKEAKGRRGRTRKIADLEFLAREYHGYMVGYVNAVIDTEAEDEILVLGLGGGGLCMYLHRCFPKAIAKRCFNFVTNDRVKVEIADGIQFVKDAATNGKKYKAILCDMDNKDSSFGMSFPPKEFLEISVLRAVAASLTQDGLFILNLGSTDMSLKEKATDDLESVFESILEYNLNSANAVVVCSAEKYNIKEWRNKFKNAIVDFDKLAIARKLSFSINIARILKSL
ncbi:hypothetical protein DMN91_000974 [Ooceraea biroi]|uniref:Methyltransferase-like protein n=1 Tax=Ooceraea biroi TaxID=2015173 RepID=A0A3L8E387_OOCBI|nr:hypothetical protein DMN91_000974 [Ooceraea biroi]